jgi:2',3'-cyclic-nucleotide 2'-phosphodiesterase (5'-nucleotidase family)
VNSTGGFRRRATYVNEQRQRAEHLLLLDTGDALVGGGILGDQTQGEAIVAGMNMMGYDAMALGPRELRLGVELLTQRVEDAEFPMLSANVVLTGTDDLFAKPYVILEAGGHRVGVIGLTRATAKPREGFAYLDAQEAAARYVPEVAKQAGTVIILTNLKYDLARELASAVPGIDLVIAALPAEIPNKVRKAPKTKTMVVAAEQPAERHTGRRVGNLFVVIGSDGRLAEEAWTTKALDRQIPDYVPMRDLLNGYRH